MSNPFLESNVFEQFKQEAQNSLKDFNISRIDEYRKEIKEYFSSSSDNGNLAVIPQLSEEATLNDLDLCLTKSDVVLTRLSFIFADVTYWHGKMRGFFGGISDVISQYSSAKNAEGRRGEVIENLRKFHNMLIEVEAFKEYVQIIYNSVNQKLSTISRRISIIDIESRFNPDMAKKMFLTEELRSRIHRKYREVGKAVLKDLGFET